MSLPLFINILAILTMITALVLALKLRSMVPGGVVKSTWNLLAALIGMFLIGYLLTPFFFALSSQNKDLVVSLIFFFGAVFIIIVINLFKRIINDLGL